MAGVLPTSAKRTNNGLFCRTKAFIRNNNAADRLTASWFAIEKQEHERNVGDPEVCRVVFYFAAVELWNYSNVLAEALDYEGCEFCGTAPRLSNCINKPVPGLGSALYTYVVQTPRVERRIFLEQIRPTVAPEPREGG